MDELILVDGIAVADPESRCAAPGCKDPPAILIGPHEDLEFCPGHTAELILQALPLIEIGEALAKKGMVALVLDEPRLGRLRHLVKLVRSQDGRIMESRRLWLEELRQGADALYDARQQTTSGPTEGGRA